ncbi:ATPase [Sorochytrium milnesiophthora]
MALVRSIRRLADVAARSLEGPLGRYEALVAAHRIRADDSQRRVAGKLQQLYDRIAVDARTAPTHPQHPSLFSSLASHLRLFRGHKSPSNSEPRVRGCYIYGGVGTGKTMTMDLLYDSLPPDVSKRRVHFHAFMIQVHQRAHQLRAESSLAYDPTSRIADELARDGRIFCFDEFQVTNIGDAMMLRRLLTELFDRDVTIIMTSNRHPDELYKNGLQRESFIPCIEMIKQQCEVIDLNSGIDYRKREQELARVYFFPLSPANIARVERIWAKLIEGHTAAPLMLPIPNLGRSLPISQAVPALKTARFTFQQLCMEALGPADYLALVDAYDTIVLTDIPKMTLDQRMEARRFITFVDAVYEHKATLICTAQVSVHQLFIGEPHRHKHDTSGHVIHHHEHPSSDMVESLDVTMEELRNSSMFSGEEEVFAFQRAVSRLAEMQGLQWLRSDVRQKLIQLSGSAVVDKKDQEQ